MKEVRGTPHVSDQTIPQLVAARAQPVSEEWAVQAQATLATGPLPAIQERVDLDQPARQEVLLELDGSVVKEQKPHRDHVPKEQKKWVSTSLACLEESDGRFRYRRGGLDETVASQVGRQEMISRAFIEESGDALQPLNLVAITDGARDIRSLLRAIFGAQILIIWDW